MKAEDGIYSLGKILSWEKKKAVIPVLMCMVLVSAIFGLSYIRDNNYDSKSVDLSLKAMEASTEYFLLKSYYNDSVNASMFEEPGSINQEDLSGMEKKKVLASLAPLFTVYKTPLFFLEPSDSVLVSDGRASIFVPRNGYYLTDVEPAFIVKSQYIGVKARELEKEFNRTSIDVFEAQSRMEQAYNRSLKYKANYLLENSNGSSDENSEDMTGTLAVASIAGSSIDRGDIYRQVAEGEVKEIQWYHFIPAFIVTFAFYYVVNAFILAGIRGVRS